MQISSEVLTELSLATTSEDGRRVKLERQVERMRYAAIDKVLRALGGIWNTKAKAHLFQEDARPLLERALATGAVTTAADLGFFETPAALAAWLVEMAGVTEDSRCLEPSAGRGAIVRELLNVGAQVTAIEIDDKRRAQLIAAGGFGLRPRGAVRVEPHGDFMTCEPRERPFDFVVMNPPFARVGGFDCIDHVRRAYAMLKPGGALVSVLPASVLFRQDRRFKEFRAWIENRGAITGLPDGTFEPSGTSVRTCVAHVTGGSP
jgi:16S rRNA G966 N2-methylase RsmD